MRASSPLRYPGGKAPLSGLLAEIRRLNCWGQLAIAEPFAGGAGASLSLLYSEETPQIFINDADSSIFAFWWALLNRNHQFCDKLDRTPIDIGEWRRQKALYRSKRKLSRIDKGFAAFYLNRCNRSGIIMNGGPIGGVHQAGKWRIDSRFNKEELQERCQKVYDYRSRIHPSAQDGLSFIEGLAGKQSQFFIDPPYFSKGKTLYLNSIDSRYHQALASKLREIRDQPWVLTYDDCPEIRGLYNGWAQIRPFSLQYAAATKRTGAEILIVPKSVHLPKRQNSARIGW